MPKILVLLAVAAFSLISVAAAQTPAGPKPKVMVSSAYHPPAPVLPNIEQHVRRLQSAERSVVQKQLRRSLMVIGFWENKGKWLRATRKEKCWQVPWQRSCTIARASYRLHTALAATARKKLWSELPTPNDWVTSVRVIQRVFPGTEAWLLSCSSAEGGHGRFVVYGGGGYYPGAEHDKTFHGDMVGGPMQYMWGTFKGHYRHGLDSLRSRGFRISLPAPDDVRAWLSPTAQAIAAGWARWSGNDNSHWSASFGNGC